MSHKGPSAGSVELPFEPIREGWSIYRVTKDEVTIMMKVVVLKFFLEGIDENGNPRLAAGSNITITANAPAKMKGPASNRGYSMKEIIDSVVEQDMGFQVVKEEWNEYKLPDGVEVGLKPVATMISRTSLHDLQGDPVYHVQNQGLFKAKVSKEARAKYAARLQPTT